LRLSRRAQEIDGGQVDAAAPQVLAAFLGVVVEAETLTTSSTA